MTDNAGKHGRPPVTAADSAVRHDADVLVIGGGPAGTWAA